MAQSTVIGAFFVIALLLGVLCRGGLLAQEAAAAEPAPGAAVREEIEHMLRGGRPRGAKVRSSTHQLRAYSEQSGVPIEDICDVLRTIVGEGRALARDGDPAATSVLYANALMWLAAVEGSDAAPLLKEIALDEEAGETAGLLRHAAMDSFVGLGGEDLVEFARAVCGNERFSRRDRYLLYWGLSRYLHARSWGTVGLGASKAERERQALRGDVALFLLDAVSDDPYTGNVFRLDQTLSSVSRFYAHRGDREEVLKKLSTDGVAKHEEHAAEELKALEKVRPEDRTRLPDDIQDPAELEGLARGVLKSPKRYLELDRLLVYEALGESVERFQGLLVGAALRDPAPDNVIAVDRMLCAASERYKMSHERERALARFEDSDVPRQKDYATRELAALRQAPEGRRTHVEFEQAWSPVSTPAIIAIVLAAALAVACGVLLHRARKRRCASRGESPGVQSEP